MELNAFCILVALVTHCLQVITTMRKWRRLRRVLRGIETAQQSTDIVHAMQVLPWDILEAVVIASAGWER